MRPGALQSQYGRADVVLRDGTVAVNTENDRSPCVFESHIHRRRNNPFRIIQQLHGKSPVAHPANTLPRIVGGTAVDDKNLHAVTGVILRQHTTQRSTDERGFVPYRQNHRHKRP